MDPAVAVRIDKWLWCVRLYKSRSLAAAACDGGKVQMSGQRVKPSRSVKPGDIISAVTGDLTRTVKVVGLLDRRVGARLVPLYLKDLTPASEFDRARQQRVASTGFRPQGAGRPTKKHRRFLTQFWSSQN